MESIMATNTIYGLGGFCEKCDSTHDHPLNNVLKIEEIPDQPNGE
jgi:hypothetical protein